MSTDPNVPVVSDLQPLSQRPAALTRVFGEQPFHTDGDLLGLGFGRDGSLWSVEDPGVLRQWDLVHGRQLRWHPIDDLGLLWEFSPGCRWIASGSEEVSLWDVAEGRLEFAMPADSWVTALAISPDEELLASGHDDGTVRVWRIATRSQTAQFNAHPKAISSLAFSPDGKALASAGEDKAIRLWELVSNESAGELIGHKDRIPALVWHPTKPLLISAGWDTTARVWNTKTCEPVILLNAHSTQLTALAMQPQGELLAVADSARSIRLWDLNRYRELRLWTEQAAEVHSLAFAPDGLRLVSGGADRVIQVRDVREDWKAPSLPEPVAARTVVALSPDGGRLYSVGGATPLRAWEVARERVALELKDAGLLRSFALSPDGHWLAASLLPAESDAPRLGLWDARTGERRAVLDGPTAPVTALAFSADSKVLATGSFDSSDVWLWDVPAGEPVLLIPGAVEGCSVESLAFHPRQPQLLVGGIDWMATGGSDGASAVWDLSPPGLRQRIPGASVSLAVHPSGDRFATCTLQRTVQVWRWPGDVLEGEIDVPSDSAMCLAYSPDGRWLAVASDDNAVRLYDAATLKQAGQVQLDTQCRSLAFDVRGENLFTGNANTSCWQINVAAMLRDAV